VLAGKNKMKGKGRRSLKKTTFEEGTRMGKNNGLFLENVDGKRENKLQ